MVFHVRTRMLATVIAIAVPLAVVATRKRIPHIDSSLLEEASARQVSRGQTLDDSELPSVDEQNTPGTGGMTFLRIKMSPSDWARKSASLLEVNSSSEAREQLSDEQRRTAWSEEYDIFKDQPAVSHIWKHSVKVYNYADSDIGRKIDAIRDQVIPGKMPPRTTFRKVLSELAKVNCPIWIIGGTIRDLLAGTEPNDVDTACMCKAQVIKNLAVKMRWEHFVSGGGKGPYFNIGKAHSDDGLEGMYIAKSFTTAFTAEWSVNVLAYSFRVDYLISPWGEEAVDDAEKMLLRPGAPSIQLKEVKSIRNKNQYQLWQKWLMDNPASARHVRYLKMRGRDWKPQSKCVQFFMANLYVIQANIENFDCHNTGRCQKRPCKGYCKFKWIVEWGGEKHIHYPGATLAYISEFVAKAHNRKEQIKYVEKYLVKMKEDLIPYFKASEADLKKCFGKKGLIARDKAKWKSWKQFIQEGMAKECDNESNDSAFFFRQKVTDFNKAKDRPNTCKHIKQYARTGKL